jgi:carboxyl-terminal processing protease
LGTVSVRYLALYTRVSPSRIAFLFVGLACAAAGVFGQASDRPGAHDLSRFDEWLSPHGDCSIPVVSYKGNEVEMVDEIVQTIVRETGLKVGGPAFAQGVASRLDELRRRLEKHPAETSRSECLEVARRLSLSFAGARLMVQLDSRAAAAVEVKGRPSEIVRSVIKQATRRLSSRDASRTRKLLWFLAVDSLVGGLKGDFDYYVYADALLASRTEFAGKAFAPGVVPLAQGDELLAADVVDPVLTDLGVTRHARLKRFNRQALDAASFHKIAEQWFRPAPFHYELCFENDAGEKTIRAGAVPFRRPTVRSAVWRDLLYLRLDSFSGETLTELRRALRPFEAEGLEGLVIDLRSNSGGVVSFGVTDCFFKPGQTIATYRSMLDGKVERVQATIEYYGYPVVLLVDRRTASMAESFAAAFSVHKRGVLIGEATRGKGVGQTGWPIGDEGELWLVETMFYLPGAEKSWDKVGITPDIEISLTDEARARIDDFLNSPVLDLDRQAQVDQALARARDFLLKEEP